MFTTLCDLFAGFTRPFLDDFDVLFLRQSWLHIQLEFRKLRRLIDIGGRITFSSQLPQLHYFV